MFLNSKVWIFKKEIPEIVYRQKAIIASQHERFNYLLLSWIHMKTSYYSIAWAKKQMYSDMCIYIWILFSTTYKITPLRYPQRQHLIFQFFRTSCGNNSIQLLPPYPLNFECFHKFWLYSILWTIFKILNTELNA